MKEKGLTSLIIQSISTKPKQQKKSSKNSNCKDIFYSVARELFLDRGAKPRSPKPETPKKRSSLDLDRFIVPEISVH